MANGLKIEFPSQGWKQLLTARKEMLDAYDRARAKATAHEVETFHGTVAEAELRKWLSSFLPKRFGVTPGYIVSNGLPSHAKAPHFDVIVYDQLDSPVLWVEDSPDISTTGRSQAIPVEYVRCVLEVKAAFSRKTVDSAIEHLADLLPLMSGVDQPSDAYKLHLPPSFCCGVVFFELRTQDQYDIAALKSIGAGVRLRGYFGGLILRGEGHTVPATGRIKLLKSATSFGDLPARTSLLQAGMVETTKVSDDLFFGATLTWMEPEFANFGFDLIAMMQGTYEVGRLSSWYGMGTTEWEAAKRQSHD
jgi:hypothetical protein